MAVKATICKLELQISDIDRHYYASHSLTLAQHPSETEQRLMLRMLAFALHADERLEFGRGLSSDDEPDLWRRSLTGEIEQWIELGQPDEARLRKASGRAREVIVLGYGGRGFGLWWDKNAASLTRLDNLRVLEISAESTAELTGLYARSMRLQCLIQEGETQISDATRLVTIVPVLRQSPAG